LVTQIRSRAMTQNQALQFLKQLPYECKNHGFGNTIHFRALFIELVNLIENTPYWFDDRIFVKFVIYI